MRYVIIRDDDTNALTPVACLERLYRPFLDRGLPVNLAVIPAVATGTRMASGQLEGFLLAQTGDRPAEAQLVGTAVGQVFDLSKTNPEVSPEAQAFGRSPSERPGMRPPASQSPILPIGGHDELVRYILDNPGYRIVQHGCHHDWLEFERPTRAEVARRLEHGTRLLMEAGFDRPGTFVAPYDKFSRSSLFEAAARFRVLSSGWYELRRLPYSWWPRYALKKARRASHWRIGRTLLLTHPGCLLSYQHPRGPILGSIARQIHSRQLTVLVTHWWEYFRDQRPDESFIGVLHETADYLACQPDLKVISFSDLVEGRIPLN